MYNAYLAEVFWLTLGRVLAQSQAVVDAKASEIPRDT
jgi:hypothetical protein